MANKRGAPGGIISLQGGGIIQESLGAIIPLQTGGFVGIGTAARTTHAIDVARFPCTQFVQPATDRAARKSRDLRHHGDAAPSRSLRLSRRKTPQGALVQDRRQRLKTQPNRQFVNHTRSLYDLDS